MIGKKKSKSKASRKTTTTTTMMCSSQVTSATVIQSVQAKMAKWHQQRQQLTSATIAVPATMQLKPSMIQSNLKDAILVKVRIDSIQGLALEGDTIRGEQILLHNKKDSSTSATISGGSPFLGSIAFVVRKPGCSFCREQALSFTVLATLYPRYFEGFQLFGIIKEVGGGGTNSSSSALMKDIIEFHEAYLRNIPLYCDKSYAFYHALGDRKVGWSVLLRPSVLYGAVCDGINRVKNTGDAASADASVGEGLVQGGIIIFGSDGKPKYAYEEETGSDLRVTDIVAALEALRRSSAS